MGDVKFGSWSDDLAAYSDAEFLRAMSWKSGTDKKLLAAAREGNAAEFVTLWAKTIVSGSKKKRSHWLGILSLALWAAPTSAESVDHVGPFRKFAHQLVKSEGKNGDKKKRAGLVTKLEKVLKKHPPSIDQPLELHVATLMLLEFSKKLPPTVSLAMIRLVLESSLKFLQTIDVPESDEHIPFDQRLFLAGELPWTISSFFANVAGASVVAKSAKQFIAEEIDARTDTDGTPQAELVGRLPLWLASFVRCSNIADLFHVKLWKADGLDRFDDVIRRTAGMYHINGRIALCDNGLEAPEFLLSEAVKVADLHAKDSARISIESISAKAKSSQLLPRKFNEANSPSAQSDWAQFAVLRNNWLAGADALAIAHEGEIPRIELTVFGTQLMAGEWNVDVVLNGEPVIPDEWAVACWNSDKDGDYLELTTDLTEGWTLDRLIFLSRNDHFCCFMDCIVGKDEADIHYQSLLPIVEQAKLIEDPTMRSVTAKSGATKTVCYPLDFPRDRVHSSPGQLKVEHGQLAVQHARKGTGLSVPLFFDWSPNRKNKLADWASLTVAEEGEILPEGHATGHRIRVGKHQWLIYHALRNSGRSRSVLGLHTLHETVIGEFNTIGDVTPLLLVDAAE